MQGATGRLPKAVHIHHEGKGRYTSSISTAVLGDDTASIDGLLVDNVNWNLDGLDTQLLIQPAESITHDVKLMSKFLNDTVDAGGVFKHIHTLGVRIVSYSEGTLDGLGKLPEIYITT